MPKRKGDPLSSKSQTASSTPEPVIPSSPHPSALPGIQTSNPNFIRAPRPLVKSDSLSEQSPTSFLLTPSPDAVIHAPKSFSTAQMPRLFDSTRSIGKEEAPQHPGPIVTPASDPGVQMPSRQDSQRVLQPLAHRLVEPAPRPLGDRMETPQVPVSHAVFDLPTTGVTARREPKVTIGQIEVQVINTPAPVQVSAAPTGAADSKGFMSAELDRFRWRLR